MTNIKLTTKQFIEKSIKIHGGRYDYCKVDYKTTGRKVEIICKIHGIFNQTPNTHLKGHGCPSCGGTHKLFIEEFIKKSKEVHGDKYDYSKANYKNCRSKVKIICVQHGIFLQEVDNHMRGQGCPKCTHHISKPEMEFLDYLQIPDTEENRQKYIKPYKVDGIDYKTNTIYEFFGDYYHGNPNKFNKNYIHPKRRKTFGELYENTIKKLNVLKHLGYQIKYIWESDWKKYKNGIVKQPNIISF